MSGVLHAAGRLYREARRRKVFRTGALYVVGAWLVLQVADVTFPGFGIPEAAIQALVWAAVIGLPIALAFGWLFEIGPEGIRRTLPATAGEAAEPQPLARRDYLILATFAAIAVVLVYGAAQEVRETPQDAAMTQADVAPGEDGERLENSIAVLPFVNISEDPANEYFCDGIAEEILDRLARAAELNVIGRTSSFAFKGSDFGIDKISALLGVRYVLQGSVRKAGDQLRVSAQLLNAKGVQVWSESFDRQLESVFEIQSEIASAVASTVASRVLPRADEGHQPDVAAYDYYLKGRELLHQRNAERAREELQKAVEVDPEFAEAHAELALASFFPSFAFAAEPTGLDRAQQSLDRALTLKPRLLRARAIQGLLFLQQDPPDLLDAERVLREVLEQDPNMSDALLWLQNTLHEQGRDAEARQVLERAGLIDPLHASVAANLAGQLFDEGKLDEAERIHRRQLAQPAPGFVTYIAAFDFFEATGRLVGLHEAARSVALSPQPPWGYFHLAESYALLGDRTSVDTWLDRQAREYADSPFTLMQRVLGMAWQGQNDEAVRQMRESLAERQMTIADLPEPLQAAAGVHLARGGEHAAAVKVLEPLYDPASPNSLVVFGPPLMHGPHALAWSYLHTGADDKATRLLTSLARKCAERSAKGPIRDSAFLHGCAETELLQGNQAQALDLLEQAVAAGWREYYVRLNDPYWATLEEHPRYRTLIAKVKADIDRQRAVIERIDAREDFAAKLDARAAARRKP